MALGRSRRDRRRGGEREAICEVADRLLETYYQRSIIRRLEPDDRVSISGRELFEAADGAHQIGGVTRESHHPLERADEIAGHDRCVIERGGVDEASSEPEGPREAVARDPRHPDREIRRASAPPSSVGFPLYE